MHLLLLALPAPALAVLVFLKPYAWYLALGVVSLLLSRRSRIDAWAESQPRLAGFMKLLRAAGLDPWEGLEAVCLIVKGRLPVKVTAGSKSISPPPLAVLALCFFVAVSSSLVVGCAGTTPEAKGAAAAQEARLVYSASAVVLTELVRLDADWMASLTDQGSAAAAASTAKKVSALLDAATAALARAKPYLATGKDAALAKQELTTALQTIEDALELLAELGKQPSPETLDALGYLHGFLLGGAS
jgi:hypothetical protein